MAANSKDAAPRVLFLMADYGHDPTETAVPYMAFHDAGFQIEFATENGKSPECDKRMLEGMTQKLLGATAAACKAYATMRSHTPIQQPLSWTSPSFSLDHYNLLFFPGGHDKGVRQCLDSTTLRSHIAKYWPSCARSTSNNSNNPSPSAGSKNQNHAVAAVCHGVLALSNTTYPDSNNKSILHDATTTTLPSAFENAAHWVSAPFLGDYYKTYGRGSENVEASVRKVLDDEEKQFKCSLSPGPFVVEDKQKWRYVSARYPADAGLLAEKAIALVIGKGEEENKKKKMGDEK